MTCSIAGAPAIEVQSSPTDMSKEKRIPTDGGQPLSHHPFASLTSDGLPAGPAEPSTEAQSSASKSSPRGQPNKNRGRVDIIRQTAHRGGKTVTVVTGFTGIGLSEKEALVRKMQKVCGTGGTLKEGRIEIQGDRREEVARILTEAGFRPVLAGG